uniref:competence/damage-inducible protein A n=1 Tax=Jeotgalibaca porci TaxID=1868793 RepID=UPI0035A0DC49
MIAEIISVGTELLLGQIVNTDAAFIAKQLAEVGINSYYQTVVGDNPVRLVEALKIAEERSHLLILTGGLGPTQDDVTKETVADYLDEELVMDDVALNYIKRYFDLSGRVMTDNNQKQALYFENGRSFLNRNGHAVGTFIQKDAHAYLLVPGPPKELTLMFDTEVRPFLETLIADDRQYIVSKTLRFFGIGESDLVTKLNSFIVNQTNPSIAPYAGDYEVTLRVTATGDNASECENLLEQTISEVLAIVGDYYYAEGDKNSLVNTVSQMLMEKNITISAAESLTGGLFQSRLVSVPGASHYFRGGIVSYDDVIKKDVLGVPESILNEYGAVSEECAMAMADQARRLFQSDIGISFTGVAGSEELEGEPPGTVWIGLSMGDGNVSAQKYRFMHGRTGNRERSVMQGLDMVRRMIK